MSVFRGKGDGSFQARRTSATGFGSSAGMITGDFNGDGIPDLASGSIDNGKPGKVGISLGNGDGTFKKEVNFDAGNPGSLSAGDTDSEPTGEACPCENTTRSWMPSWFASVATM